MNNLREVFRKYKAVVFFDVETTGLDAKTCRIIELAAIRIERAGDGTLYTAGRADMLIKLPGRTADPRKDHRADRDHGRTAGSQRRD